MTKEEQYLEINNINFTKEKRFSNCRHKRTLPFDFHLPDYNICIEFDGKQHFDSIKRCGGKKGLKIRQKRDKIKDKCCKDMGIILIRIPYTEFNNIEKILKDRIC